MSFIQLVYTYYIYQLRFLYSAVFDKRIIQRFRILILNW